MSDTMTAAELQREVATTRQAIVDLLTNLVKKLPEGFAIEDCDVHVCTEYLNGGGFGAQWYDVRISIEVVQ
jgi:hypothetical protein